MRYLALAVILLTLPLFINLLRQGLQRRALAFMFIGAMLCIDGIHIGASVIGWPLWNGTARGIEISLVDTLAIALIATRSSAAKPSFLGPLLFYGLALGMSVLWSAVAMASFFSFWQYLRIVLIFAAVAGEADNPRLRHALLNGFAIGMIVEAIVVAQQKVGGVVQATGTAVHQNTLGMEVELALLPMLGALLTGDRSPLLKAGILAGVLVVAAGGSRGAIGFAGGAMLVLLVLSTARRPTPAKLRLFGIAALLAIVAVPVGMVTLRDRFGSNAIIAGDSERMAFERAARAMAADYPFGVGANVYVPIANKQGYADRAGVAWNFSNRSAPVHNAYLLARAETGWLGEIAFILLLLVPALTALALGLRNRTGMAGDIALSSGVAILANALHNNYEFAVFTYHVFGLVITNVAIVAAMVRAARPAATNPATGKGPLTAARARVRMAG